MLTSKVNELLNELQERGEVVLRLKDGKVKSHKGVCRQTLEGFLAVVKKSVEQGALVLLRQKNKIIVLARQERGRITVPRIDYGRPIRDSGPKTSRKASYPRLARGW